MILTAELFRECEAVEDEDDEADVGLVELKLLFGSCETEGAWECFLAVDGELDCFSEDDKCFQSCSNNSIIVFSLIKSRI